MATKLGMLDGNTKEETAKHFRIEEIAKIVAILFTSSYRDALLAMRNSAGACERLFRLKIQELEWQWFVAGVGRKLSGYSA